MRAFLLLVALSTACGGAVTAVDDGGSGEDASPIATDASADAPADASVQVDGARADVAPPLSCAWNGPACGEPGVGCCFDGGFFECDPADAGFTWQPLDAGAWPCP